MNFKQLIAAATLSAMAAGSMAQGVAVGERNPSGTSSVGARPMSGGPHKHPVAPGEPRPHGCKETQPTPSASAAGAPGKGSSDAKRPLTHPLLAKCGPLNKPPASTDPVPATKK